MTDSVFIEPRGKQKRLGLESPRRAICQRAEERLKALVADGRAVWEETGLCWRPAVNSLYEVTGTALHKKLWNSLATDHPIIGLQQLQNHRELQTQDKDKKQRKKKQLILSSGQMFLS
ncbi:unnamed protein product [Leuciscus chuanchicus]